MLIGFSVSNFRSFDAIQRFNLTAVAGNTFHEANNIVSGPSRLRLLRSAVIYGANASGKTNLLQAIAYMRGCVIDSVNNNQWLHTRQFFQLKVGAVNEPTQMIIDFSIANTWYSYGFAIGNDGVVTEEYLGTHGFDGHNVTLFHRLGTSNNFNIQGEFIDARGLEARTRPDALFLTVCSQFAVRVAVEVVNWFRDGLSVFPGPFPQTEYYTTERFATDPAFAQSIINFLRESDTAVQSVIVEAVPNQNGGQLFANNFYRVNSVHNVYDANGNAVSHVAEDFNAFESLGTRKLFALTGPLLDALNHGKTFFFDELDGSLHPMLTTRLLALFNNAAMNRNGAQLIFTTHDAVVPDSVTYYSTTKRWEPILRADQVFFASKGPTEATSIYSMSNFPRLGGDFPGSANGFYQSYINGEFGAVPSIRYNQGLGLSQAGR